MQFLTSSYQAWRPGSGSPVSISLTRPRWRPEAAAWPQCWALCPRWQYFRAPAAEFDAAYLAQLDRYGVQRIHADLSRIAREAYEAPSQRLVLVCWETRDVETTCHRRLFARWLLETCGELVPELDAAGDA